jgi:hypothetical protein
MRNAPDGKDLRHPHKTFQPDVGRIRSFLLNKEYVVTGTDKNLGIAVSKRDWIIEKSQDILNDVNNYRSLDHFEATSILNQKCAEMEEIARIAFQHLDASEGTLSDFMRSCLPARGDAYHIPRFYGIPKIHKQPVKMRPIIPCHSAVMNPAAKYVSKKLKPIVETAATIIHGTKDLAQKLSSLDIDHTRKWYIVTGDVVAFYPNIPLEHCLKIVEEQYIEYKLNTATHPDDLNKEHLEVFKRCLTVGNTRLITQFKGQIYEQLNGLAMGVADSPDLANLYGYYFEKRADVLNHPNIFYYGRYIDDCLAIVYAESEHHALSILQDKIQFDNCVITWDCSDSHQPFLDMLLYKDADNTLQHMPYRKRGNHQERIPWISAHPYDVKRGTFLGEMSRLATLSSKLEHYSAAMTGLVTLYISRGYPVDEVHKWLYSNYTRRWENRLKDRQVQGDSANILVLKSQYNLAWNYFNAHQLGDVIFDYWREWLRRADSGNFDAEYPAPPSKKGPQNPYWDIRETDIFNSRVIVSRKRTRNLLDLTNLWKRSVLQGIEEQALDDIVNTAAQYTALQRPVAPDDINTQVVGPVTKNNRDQTNDDDMIVYHRAHSPEAGPSNSAWRNATMGTWGRGSRP